MEIGSACGGVVVISSVGGCIYVPTADRGSGEIGQATTVTGCKASGRETSENLENDDDFGTCLSGAP